MKKEIFVTEEASGDRVDKFLSEQCEEYSRSFLQKLMKSGGVFADGRPVKASYRVSEGDRLTFEVPEAVEPEILAENIPLDILYEDRDVILVNKPKGMVVHPAAGHYTGTLVNALMYHCREDLSGINGVLRPGIVHRIDMDTTGVIIACKNDMAHNSIAAQLKEHADEKAAQYREEAAAKIEAAKNVKAAMTASRNERIAAMSSRMTELTKKRQDMMKHMNFYRRSILRGNPSASSMKFAAALKELREAAEKRNK